MTSGEALYQILLAVLIVAAVFLILVLWRLFRILTNVDEAVVDLKLTISQISGHLKHTAEQISSLSSNLGFLTTIFEKVAESLKGYFTKKTKS